MSLFVLYPLLPQPRLFFQSNISYLISQSGILIQAIIRQQLNNPVILKIRNAYLFNMVVSHLPVAVILRRGAVRRPRAGRRIHIHVVLPQAVTLPTD